MRDPHVNSLRFRVETGKNISYVNPPPIGVETTEFRAELKEGILTFDFKQHYDSVERARVAVRDFIRGWEIHAALTLGRGHLNFVYDGGEIIDRNPPPSNGSIPIEVADTVIFTESSVVALHSMLQDYPHPPQMFKLTPDVETLWHRYEGYLDGKEPILAMANFCLTYVVWISQNHFPNMKPFKAVSEYLAVHESISRMLSKLAATAGDLATARKVKVQSTLKSLSTGEIHWIEEAVKLLIRRVGEYGSGATLTVLTMADLPSV